MAELKPCPFCGSDIRIVICDDEGNLRSDDYENDPWSGLGYKLYHDITDDLDKNCPIAGHEFEGTMGVWIYDTREEAIEAWNRRERSDSMGKTLYCVYNEETGYWEERPEPFATVEYETEEDFEHLKDVLDFYKKHRWISVKDRLPEHKATVLIYVEQTKKYGLAYYDKESEFFWDDASLWKCFPTHWMPLPEPPEEE